MKKTALVVMPMLAFLSLLPVPATYGSGQSQIVLSCTTANPSADGHPANPCISSECILSPVTHTCVSGTTPPIIIPPIYYVIGGFWVWCQNPSSGTPYGPDCKGSMYIAEVNFVNGEVVYETTSISGAATGGGATPTATIASSDGDMVCILTASGSTLIGSCDGVPITFTNVNIQVT